MPSITSSADDIIEELWNLSKSDLKNAEIPKKQLWGKIKAFNKDFLRNPYNINDILESDIKNFTELDINALNKKIEKLNMINGNNLSQQRINLNIFNAALNKLRLEKNGLTSSNLTQTNDFDNSDDSDDYDSNLFIASEYSYDDEINKLFKSCNSFDKKVNTLFELLKKLYEYITQEELSLELEDSSDKYEKLNKLSEIVSHQFSYLGRRINVLTNYKEKLNNFLQAKNFSDILEIIRDTYNVLKTNSQYGNFYDDLYSNSNSNEKRLTLLFLVTKYDFNNRLSNEISNDYQSFKNENLTSLLIFIKNEFNENEFLKNIGLSNRINANKNYDTPRMRLKIQKSFYLIQDPAILYMLAEYLNNYIFFDCNQVEYIKNKFKESNGCKYNLSHLYKKVNYDDIEPNYFQAGLYYFFNPVAQASVSLLSLLIMIYVLSGLTLGPIGFGLTIGICGFVTLTSLIFAIRDFKILFSEDKNGEITSDILMDYFKESNEKKLLSTNKIGEPPQNTQTTVEQEEEFTDNYEPATLQIPEASIPMPHSEQYDNQQSPGRS